MIQELQTQLMREQASILAIVIFFAECNNGGLISLEAERLARGQLKFHSKAGIKFAFL